MPLLRALAAVEERLVTCATCGNVDTSDPCAICADCACRSLANANLSQWKPACSYPISLTVARTAASISASSPGAQFPAVSMIPLPRSSPASTTRLVVVSVSHAIRASGSLFRNRSTMVSEIWSATLSGWPSDTDSEVNRNVGRIRPRPYI